MARYTVIESTNMQSTGHGSKRIFSAVSDVDIENGTLGHLNGLAGNYSHIYNFAKGVVDGEAVVIVDNPAWDVDTCKRSNQRRDKYIIPAGTPFRVRVVAINDEFAISAEGIEEATRSLVVDTANFTETDVYVTVNAEGKLKASAIKEDNQIFEGKIERKRVVGGVFNIPVHEYGYSYTLYEVKILSAKGGNC